VGRHSTVLSREEHRVAASALFYKVEGEKHCVIRSRYWIIESLYLCLHSLNYIVPSNC
jgi:hypothetical protein